MTERRGPTTDACFVMGSSHTVCDDYALAGRLASGRLFALVADGCSSSPATDVGSRIVAHAARSWLELGRDGIDLECVMRRAAMVAELLELPPDCLDATLLTAELAEERVRVCVVGDGVVAARRRHGGIEAWHFDCHGAPSYPSYVLDEDRLQMYAATYGRRTVTHVVEGAVVEEVAAVISATAPALVCELDLLAADYDLVALFSDGADSFRQRTNGVQEPIAWLAVVTELLAVKTTAGRFMQRRTKRFLGHTCIDRGWDHFDDLSVAAIALAEDVS